MTKEEFIQFLNENLLISTHNSSDIRNEYIYLKFPRKVFIKQHLKPKMVNKQEFIEKTVNYFTPILKTYCSEKCVKELIDGFVNSMEK